MLTATGIISLLSINVLAIPTISNSSQTKTNTSEDSDLGQPTGRTQGISRDGSDTLSQACLDQLIAVVPGKEGGELHKGENCNGPDSSINEAARAYTSTDMSSVWVYVPEVYADSTLTAELTLIDDLHEIERWNVQLPSSAGVVCLTLPYALENENVYRWRFHIKQDAVSFSESPKVSGLIEYSTQSETYWYDDVARLGNFQQAQTTSVDSSSVDNGEAWTQLLTDNGLGAIASAPIVSTCSGHFHAEIPELEN